MEASARSEHVIHVGDLAVLLEGGLVIVGDDAVALSVREFELLLALARREGRIARRDELYERVWGKPLRPGDRSIDVYIRKLRVKLARVLPGCELIHTHVAFGYRLQAEPSRPFHSPVTRS